MVPRCLEQLRHPFEKWLSENIMTESISEFAVLLLMLIDTAWLLNMLHNHLACPDELSDMPDLPLNTML